MKSIISFPGLGIGEFEISRTAFKIGDIKVTWYGMIICLGIILAFSYFCWRAMKEGIIFDTLCNPVEILGYHNAEDKRDPKNGSVAGIRCIRMELGEPDEKGRRRPVEVPGSEFDMEMDCVIMALGTNPNPLIKATTKGLEVNKHGGIIVDENALTSREGVYAGGDAVTGAATVILAMGAGKQAAAAIDEYLKNK